MEHIPKLISDTLIWMKAYTLMRMIDLLLFLITVELRLCAYLDEKSPGFTPEEEG